MESLAKVIAIDFESYLISEATPHPRPVCLSFYDGKEEGIYIGADMETYLEKILSGPDLIVAQNMSFEAGVIYTHFPRLKSLLKAKINAGELLCTKVYEMLLNATRLRPNERISLAGLVNAYFSEDISATKTDPDAWRMRYSELDGIPLIEWPKEAIEYSIQDSIWAYKIAEIQLHRDLVFAPTVKADIYFSLMGNFGLTIDKSRVAELKREIQEKLAPRYESLIEAGLVRKDKNGKHLKNMKQFKELLKNANLTLDFTVKGAISTKKEMLEGYKAQLLARITAKPVENDRILHKALEDFCVLMEYEKVMTAFITRLEQANPIIRTNYTPSVRSGRTSASTTKIFPSINIQQIPREVPDVKWDLRNCFIPRPGFKFVSVDFEGFELATAANALYDIFGESNMLNIINSGDSPIDMHSKFAAQLKKTSYEDFCQNKKKEDYSKIRNLAKRIGLGLPGGLGSDTIRTQLLEEGIVTRYEELPGTFERMGWTKNPKTNKWEQEFKGLQDARFHILELQKANPELGKILRAKEIRANVAIIVLDEIVGLKSELFSLYPELEEFLKNKHLDFLNGVVKKKKNKLGKWEDDPLYQYEINGFIRDNCTYTEHSNGRLMQTAAALGVKEATCRLVDKYYDSPDVNILAMIHDEILAEIRDDENLQKNLDDIAEIMIDGTQSQIRHPRIAVGASVMDHWSKTQSLMDIQYWKNPNDAILHKRQQ